MRVGIALGSNLGDRLDHLRRARAAVETLPGISGPFLASRVYETEPIDTDPDSRPFLNAVMEVDFDAHPLVLLEALQKIEAQFGRPSKRPRNAPRPIDLDVLYAGNLVLSNEEIMIPHPRLHLRRFVLQPLSEIRPQLVLPGHEQPIAALLADLREPGDVKLFAENW
ncbi:2-amino-4-hydroxy-6-hydroxymethyldihydropteridine diphosphokinase [Verrucomicrobiota bacterium sgz303538]